MKVRFAFVAAVILAFSPYGYPTPAQAQSGGPAGSGPGVGGSTVPMGGQMGHGTMTQDQFNKLQDYADLAHRLTKEDKDKGRTLKDLLAEDKAAASDIAATTLSSCQVDQAILAAAGPATVSGKTIQTKTYEVACMNGMGYFLVTQDPGSPYAISCFTADATRTADIAAGRTPGAVCELPPNANVNAMATSLMSHAGAACTVDRYRSVGQSSAAHTEYDEVACSDKTGYMLAIALPGSNASVRVSTCHDSAMRGLACQLSDNGTPIISVQTFKDALAQHSIACDANSDNDIHVIGQESIQKRYVVEFRCSQRPAGLVAFIPLNGSGAPFEAVSCATASKRHVSCKLTATQ